MGSRSFTTAAVSPPPPRHLPAVGRALIAQIHRHCHEGARQPGVGDDPQVGRLVPAQPGEGVGRALRAVGGQLQGGARAEWEAEAEAVVG